MSRFLDARHAGLEPYVPGEQPKEARSFIKLNTNESPFPPAPSVAQAVAQAAERLELYNDPQAWKLTCALAAHCGVEPDQIAVGNGSDDILNFLFMAFCGEDRPAAFADITYGFYPVFAQVNHVPYEEVPLREDFTLNLADYGCDQAKFFVFANPNAPTGMALAAQAFVDFARANPDSLVVVDEAYVDFGGESCVPYVDELDNLIVVQTFSKSRSLAGGRFGFAVGPADLIADVHAMRYSTNPYNVNSMTQAAACATLGDADYTKANCAKVAATRAHTTERLRALGFEVLDSRANFVFARHARWSGAELYARLREKDILVRHFTKSRISDFLRITIGTDEQMDALVSAFEDIMEERHD